VNGGQAAVVTSVHGLKHVDGLTTTNLADHDAIGTHTKRVAYQISLRYFTTAFDVGWSCFESDDVRLLELKFRRVFDGDDTFVLGNICRKRVQQCRFTGAGTT
jgi:hypothetical protein